MAKIALLIGVSEYGPGLNPLAGAARDVEAVQQVLQHKEMGGFDKVKCLSNPNPPVMREAMEALFSDRSKNDTVLLFFSGHLIQDETNKLYFATSITSKTARAHLIRVSAIPISFVNNLMNNSPCQRQVIILDGCINRIWTQEMTVSDTVSDDENVGIEDQLGGKGRAIFTSFSSSQNLSKPENLEHSVYTRYFVEGIKTGAADLDSDGWISVDELHEYASNRVKVVAPAMKPMLYPVKHEERILLSKAPIGDPKLSYRKQAETWVNRGEISETGRYLLDKFAQRWQITSQECSEIEAEVLKPHQEYQEKLKRYEQEYKSAILNNDSLSTQEREDLKRLQQFLRLKDEDVAPIEERIALNLARISESKDDTDQVLYTNFENELNSVPLMPSEVLLEPEYTSVPAIQPIDPIPAINLPSSLADSKPTSPSTSRFLNKLLLLIGIGGGLAGLGLAFSVLSRTSIAPSLDSADTVSSSSDPSPKPSSSAKNSEIKPSPSPSPSPESQVCTIFVNGNLRSEPTPFRDNVVESLRESIPVTGKRTNYGWVQVKLSSGRLAWAYPGIISSASEQEMEACLARKKIPIKTIEDILPPE
jgi:hypothetical protein